MSGSLLLVLPVPFRMIDGALHVEAQAANGLDRWADNFTSLTAAAPLIPEHLLGALDGVRWKAIKELEHGARIACVPLPWAYSPGAFLRHYKPTRRLLAELIWSAEYLQFAIGGLWGDWAAVAALEAAKQGRKYAIHTDRVEHELMRKTAGSASPLKRVKIALEAPLVERLHRHAIEHCSLGLWHGDDCFRAYSPWCSENHLVHDVHTKSSDLIGKIDLEAKIADALSAAQLHIVYAGRIDPMKAPLEWLAALATARDAGVPFTATWFGEGSLKDAALAERDRLGLAPCVHFAGFVAGRAELLKAVRDAHVTVFTHITPESPRNLLESLVSGTPILGYESAYSADLLKEFGGGELVPVHDTATLAGLIAGIAKNRGRLGQMIQSAAANGQRFTDEGVFAERSELIKRFA